MVWPWCFLLPGCPFREGDHVGCHAIWCLSVSLCEASLQENFWQKASNKNCYLDLVFMCKESLFMTIHMSICFFWNHKDDLWSIQMDIASLATLLLFLFLSGAPEEGPIAPGSRIPHGHLANERFAWKILRLVSMAILSRTVFRLRIPAGNDGRGEWFVLGSLSLNVNPENWRNFIAEIWIPCIQKVIRPNWSIGLFKPVYT